MPVWAQTTIDRNGIPVLETFSNKSVADTNQVVHQGECGKDSFIFTENWICTMEYIPVCANFNGIPKTFWNICGAGNLEIISQGECK